jgi:hypothetical protein
MFYAIRPTANEKILPTWSANEFLPSLECPTHPRGMRLRHESLASRLRAESEDGNIATHDRETNVKRKQRLLRNIVDSVLVLVLEEAFVSIIKLRRALVEHPPGRRIK